MLIYDAVNIYYVDLKVQYYTKYKQYNTAEYKNNSYYLFLRMRAVKIWENCQENDLSRILTLFKRFNTQKSENTQTKFFVAFIYSQFFHACEVPHRYH